MELKKRTIKTVLMDWKENLEKQGLGAFWPSFAYGQYIKPDNVAAQQNIARRRNRKYPDVKSKVVRRRGKNIIVQYNRKTGAIITTDGMSSANVAKTVAKNKRVAAQRFYFSEDNALHAITAMIKMPRNLRRTLCRKLSLKWRSEYREAEAMIMENI